MSKEQVRLMTILLFLYTLILLVLPSAFRRLFQWFRRRLVDLLKRQARLLLAHAVKHDMLDFLFAHIDHPFKTSIARMREKVTKKRRTAPGKPDAAEKQL